MRYKAIFFDRDQTLTYRNEQTGNWIKRQMEEWSGKPYEMDYDRMMYLFELAEYPDQGMKTIEDEVKFWHRYFTCLLKEEGISQNLEEKVELIFQNEWMKERLLYSEVVEVLKSLKEEGYQLGVISNTSPSLKLTLESLGIAKYFDCFICSDAVGVMKPEAGIYKAALQALNLKADECIYIDDYEVEAEGARKLGFTTFLIQRNEKEKKDEYEVSIKKIHSLKEIVGFLHESKI